MARQTFDDAVPAWRPEAIVFDVDGLLVDTEPCWTVAETELFRRRGRPFGDEEKALLIGRSLAAAALTLADEFDEPGNEELRSSAPPRRGRCAGPKTCGSVRQWLRSSAPPRRGRCQQR